MQAKCLKAGNEYETYSYVLKNFIYSHNLNGVLTIGFILLLYFIQPGKLVFIAGTGLFNLYLLGFLVYKKYENCIGTEPADQPQQCILAFSRYFKTGILLYAICFALLILFNNSNNNLTFQLCLAAGVIAINLVGSFTLATDFLLFFLFSLVITPPALYNLYINETPPAESLGNGVLILVLLAWANGWLRYKTTRTHIQLQKAYSKMRIKTKRITRALHDQTDQFHKRYDYEKELNRNLENILELNRQIFESTSSGVFAVDVDGKITEFNHAMEKITGVNAEKVYGYPFPAIFTRNDISTVYEKFFQMEKNGDPFILDNIDVIGPNGRVCHCELSMQPIQMKNKTKSYVATLINNSRKKQYEKLQKLRIEVLHLLNENLPQKNIYQIILNSLSEYYPDADFIIHTNDSTGHGNEQLIKPATIEITRANILQLLEQISGTSRPSPLDLVMDNNRVPEWDLVKKTLPPPLKNYQNCWIFPVYRHKKEWNGALFLMSDKLQEPESEDLDLIHEIIPLIHAIQEKTELTEKIKERNREIESLFRFSSEISKADSIDDLAKIIHKTVKKLAKESVKGGIKLFETTNGQLKLLYDSNMNDLTTHPCLDVKTGECLCGQAFLDRKTLSGDVKETSSLKLTREQLGGCEGYIIVPLEGEKECNGVLCIHTAYPPEDHHPAGRLLTIAANEIGKKIDKINLFNKTRDLSLKDPLTNLANRRVLDTYEAELMGRVTSDRGTFCTILFDLDHFKEYNDENGHCEGDKLLKETANIFLDEIRENDLCVRYGGEEFLIILDQASIEQAHSIANRIRIKVLNHTGVSISGGVTEYFPSDDSLQKAINRSDEALYTAKKRRNTIINYDPNLEQGPGI